MDRLKPSDAEYEKTLDSIMLDLGQVAWIMGMAVSMLHKLSPLQERLIVTLSQKIAGEYVSTMAKEDGVIDYMDAYGVREALSSKLLKELSAEADKMPEKTLEEIQEEVLLTSPPVGGVT